MNFLGLAVVLGVGHTSVSCGLSRNITSSALIERLPGYLDEYAHDIQIMDADSRERVLGSTQDAEGTYDILSLSGGGAFGAFGIGVLTGWGEVDDPSMRRPTFDSVAGISTGALIAPFAFIGTDSAYAKIADVYRSPGTDWVQRRGLLGYLPSSLSLFNVSKLHGAVRETVTPELIQDLARGSEEGRQLLVGATNIDFGLMRVWDLARTAHESSLPLAEEHIEQVLIASAAIPGVFPPVEIDGLLHVDGGATLQMLTGLEERDWLLSADSSERLLGLPEDEQVRIRIWVIVNQKLLPDVRAVPPRWTSIGARSLQTLVRSSALQSLQDLEIYSNLVSRLPEIDVEFRYISIPQSFEIPDSEAMFDAEVMEALFHLGQRLGQDPQHWRRRALRPGAPFERSRAER